MQEPITERQIQDAQQPEGAGLVAGAGAVPELPAPAAAPGPSVVTDAQALQMTYDGRQRLTVAVNALRALREWNDTYTERGGAEVFGPEAAEVAALNTDLQGAFNAAKRAIFARLRTDI